MLDLGQLISLIEHILQLECGAMAAIAVIALMIMGAMAGVVITVLVWDRRYLSGIIDANTKALTKNASAQEKLAESQAGMCRLLENVMETFREIR